MRQTWKTCGSGWMVCGIRWTGCSGDLQTFHKLDDAPLLSGEYHGKIFIEEKFWEEVRLCGCYLRFWHFRL